MWVFLIVTLELFCFLINFEIFSGAGHYCNARTSNEYIFGGDKEWKKEGEQREKRGRERRIQENRPC